jgi:hypothetical protein
MTELETLRSELAQQFKIMDTENLIAQNCLKSGDIIGYFNAAEKACNARDKWHAIGDKIVYLIDFELGYRIK